ncbi:MAG: hypothetical protein A4E59_00638 [Syntrophorhabdus sp. PtaB.Bin027]|nr:MAG: hypothetical protein A4E59_00638 [Syntrophorhabdus sp. PtaB.Bin027]
MYEGIIVFYFFPGKKFQEEFLWVDIQLKVVDRAHRCTDFAAQAHRKIFPIVTGKPENHFMIFLIHRSLLRFYLVLPSPIFSLFINP